MKTKKHSFILSTIISFILFIASSNAFSREYISIVGSSTVYPFATVVAETFGKKTGIITPKIESTGSGGGLKLFCAGDGINTPDITDASRRIKKSEFKRCASNGVTKIVEVKIGYDGIVLANSKKVAPYNFSLRELYLALAKTVPNKQGKLVLNPYKKWSDINPNLPNVKIEVYGPPPTSGTRDAFVELALDRGCSSFSFLKAMKKTNKNRFKSICGTLREDGGYIEAGENDNLIVAKLVANPNALGIFGFSYLDQNSDTIQGSAIKGVGVSFKTIANGSYPLSRPLFFYIKKDHIGKVPGIKKYVAEFTSNAAWGTDGYLSDRGMIPMSKKEAAQVKITVNNLTLFKYSLLKE